MTLVALDADTLRALSDPGATAVDGPATGTLSWPSDDRRVLRYRREALDADPASAPYLLHVLLDKGEVIGRVGCHAGPRDGTVEIGYFVAPAHRGRGVATAMVAEFLDWLATQGVVRVRATVGPENTASRALLARFGFDQVGEQWDEEDGLELVLERPLGLRGWSDT